MTILQIKYFITVAGCLSYTRASEQLFLSQPALSRHIRNMEEELNIQLFIRTGNGIRLTPAGSALLLGLTELCSGYDALVSSAKKIQMGLNGKLYIGILDGQNVADFMPAINRHFSQRYPNVELVFHTGSFETMLSGLYSGKLDMAFTLCFEVTDKESLLFQPVSQDKDYIVMSKFHPLAQKKRVTLCDLTDEKLILTYRENKSESASLILDLCREQGCMPAEIHYAKTLAEKILWLETGGGVSVMNGRSSLRFNPDIKFYELECHWDPSLAAVWNRSNDNPLISVFLEQLNETLQSNETNLQGSP